jgi:hypothetical protein
MKHHWGVRVVRALVILTIVILIVVAGFGNAVLHLWNWLMPSIFGLPVLTFWQAVGLLGLSWILFGGWRGFPGRSRPWGRGMRDRWEQMTPAQREDFRKAMAGRCGYGPGSPGVDVNG